MSRFKLAVVSMFAVAAVCAMAAGSASAATVVPTRYFVEGTELNTVETIDGVLSVALLNTVLAGTKVLIECTANELVPTGNNSVEGGGKSHTEASFKQCYSYVIKSTGVRELLKNCKIAEPITFSVTDQLILGPGGLVEDEVKPTGVEETFVSITLESTPGETCTTGLKGTFKIKGSYTASFGAEGERQLTEHELIFNSAGSKIKLGSEPASFVGSILRLKFKSNKSWYV